MFEIIQITGENTTSSNANVNITTDNPLSVEPDKIYVLWINNCDGLNVVYNPVIGYIQAEFINVPAGATAVANIYVAKRHSIERGEKILSETVNQSSNTVSVPFEPDLVLVRGGYLTSRMAWEYNEDTGEITFSALLTDNTHIDIIKLHSIQDNQNAISDTDGILHDQWDKPDILMQKGLLMAFDKSFIDVNYDPDNERISGLAAETEYISIRIHSIFRG